MLTSVKELNDDFIGNYMQEYINSGLYEKPCSIKKVLNERERLRESLEEGEIKKINMGSFASYVLEVLSSNNDYPIDIKKLRKMKDYSMIRSRILSKSSKRLMNSSDYEKVEQILDDYQDLKSYTDDFALMVLYAQQECFCNRETQDDMFESLISEKERTSIRNFYAELDDYSFTINNITISYTKLNEEASDYLNKRLKIESPLLLKMMLFQFAKEYYKFVEGADHDNFNLEHEVNRCLKKNPKGNPGHIYSKALTALVHVYWKFMESRGLFQNFKTIKEKYSLIGKLLTIAGHPKYIEDERAYTDEADYHYKVLRKSWSKKKTEKKRTK